mmetsp:Transcript_19458/g.49863  ORF Transcript_19458/g.49863 Transcript_19458/m.49863 type:complete len:186 (-) Transcript_19458:173-730(-)
MGTSLNESAGVFVLLRLLRTTAFDENGCPTLPVSLSRWLQTEYISVEMLAVPALMVIVETTAAFAIAMIIVSVSDQYAQLSAGIRARLSVSAIALGFLPRFFGLVFLVWNSDYLTTLIADIFTMLCLTTSLQSIGSAKIRRKMLLLIALLIPFRIGVGWLLHTYFFSHFIPLSSPSVCSLTWRYH